MRLIGRGILIGLLALVFWWSSAFFAGLFQEKQRDFSTPYPEIPADRVDVYLLTEATSDANAPAEPPTLQVGETVTEPRHSPNILRFALDQKVDRLQITSMALLPASAYPTPELDKLKGLEEPGELLPPYSLKYRLFDKAGQLLHEQQYWLETRPVSWLNWQDKYAVPELFVSESRYHLAHRQAIFLRLSEWPQASQLELEMANQPESIEGAVVYVQQRFKRDKEEITQFWRKLSETKRAAVTEDKHIYPHYLWSNAEIETLLSRPWQRIGPLGIVDQDFRTLGFYRVGELGSPLLPETNQPVRPERTLWLADNKRLTLPVYSAGRVVLNLRALEPAPEGAEVYLRWHTVDDQAPVDRQIKLDAATEQWQAMLQPGLLELWSDQVVEVERMEMPDQASMQHDPHFTRLLLLTPDNPLEYQINHHGTESTPLRIELRAFKEPTNMSTALPAKVSAHWMAKGKELDTSYHDIDPQPALYERLADDRISPAAEQLDHVVSMPSFGFYRASPNLDRLRLQATSPVLVQVSTRPPKLPLIRELPRHRRNWFDDEQFMSSWFALRPEQYQTHMREQASRLLVMQHKPLRETDEDALDTRVGEVLHPLDRSANVVHLLLPEKDESSLAQSSPQRIFYALAQPPRDKAINARVTFTKDAFSQTVRPTLVFIGDRQEPQEVSIALDGQEVMRKWLGGPWGKVALPAIRSGQRDFRLAPANGQWYLNMLASPATPKAMASSRKITMPPMLLATEGYQIAPKTPLRYQVEKKDALTMLSFTLYREPQMAFNKDQNKQTPNSQTKLEVSLLAEPRDGQHTGLSIPVRQWLLDRPNDPEQNGWQLNQGNKRVDSGQRFVYVLAEDLPAGSYQVQVKVLSGPGGLLRTTRLTERDAIEIDYYREPVHAY